MKYIILSICIIALISCKNDPPIYKNGFNGNVKKTIESVYKVTYTADNKRVDELTAQYIQQYNNNGQPVSVHYYDPNFKFRDTFIYNNKLLIEKNRRNKDGIVYSQNTFVYDTNKKLIRETIKLFDDRIESIHHYTYSDNGNTINEKRTYPDGRVNNTYVYKTNNDKDTIELNCYEDTTLKYTDKIKYDANHNKTEKTTHYVNAMYHYEVDDTYDQKELYKYDNANHLIQLKHYKDSTLEYIFEYKYDVHGSQIEWINLYGDSTINHIFKTHWEYGEIDKLGNWLEKSHLTKEVGIIIRREFTYY